MRIVEDKITGDLYEILIIGPQVVLRSLRLDNNLIISHNYYKDNFKNVKFSRNT